MRSTAIDALARAVMSVPSAAVPVPGRVGGGQPGEVSQALLAAAVQAPATVRELAARACVGYAAARYTATRMVSRGVLVPVTEGRPMVLAAAPACSFWEQAEDES